MKYYRIEIERLFDNNKRIRSSADGTYIPNARCYFDRMSEGEIIEDAPVFNHFVLRNHYEPHYINTEIMDAHDFAVEGSQIRGWFVSADLKLLLDNFKLPHPHCFYPSKLLHEGGKKNYCIYQYGGRRISHTLLEKYVNFSDSIFYSPGEEKICSINSLKELIEQKNRIAHEVNFPIILANKRLVFREFFDLYPMSSSFGDNIVSENLKQAIETMGITGFNFSELDYEVVIKGD